MSNSRTINVADNGNTNNKRIGGFGSTNKGE